MKQQNINKNKPIALVYCRVSTEKQEEKGTSLDSQADACIEYAKANNYEVAAVCKEVFSGAYLFDRPMLNAQREQIRAGAYDVVISYSIDRLSRDVAHLAIIADEIERNGAKLLFVTEDLDNTAEGKLMQSVKAFVAEVERQKIRERSMRGRQTKLKSGKLVKSSCELYGYRTDKETGKRIIVENEAAIIRRIFKEYVEGSSIRSIYINLNKEGVPTPGQTQKVFKDTKAFVNVGLFGKTLWGSGSIHRILKQIAYTGKTYANKYQAVEKISNGRRRTVSVMRSENEWIELPDDTTPAIVSPALFSAAKVRFETNKGDAARNETRPVLLRGLVKCFCGHGIYPASEKGGKYQVYRCGSIRHGKACKLPGTRIQAKQLEDLVWNEIVKIITQPENLKRELQYAQKDQDRENKQLIADVVSTNAALKKVEAELKRLIARVAELDETLWAIVQREIDAKTNERKRLTELLTETESRLQTHKQRAHNFENIKSICKDFEGKLQNASFSEKRAICEALGVDLVANNKQVRLQVSFIAEAKDLEIAESPSLCNNNRSRCVNSGRGVFVNDYRFGLDGGGRECEI